MTDKSEQHTSRRGFLKLAGTAAPAVAVAVSTGSASAEGVNPVDLSSDRMQDTAHTRAYLDSARF